MTASKQQTLDFSDTIRQLNHELVWEYETRTRRTCGDVAQETFACLQSPRDFPPLEQAIIPGDRVAIAVDANIPSIAKVVEGALRAVRQAGAGEIDIVVSDEASEMTLESIIRIAGDQTRVSRHECSKRESLRYLGADEGADPIYLNRWLVDADFVLPIAAVRTLDAVCDSDLTGIFPTFSDSRARARCLAHHAGAKAQNQDESNSSEQPAWLLGIQIMLCVTANHLGQAGEIFSGTPAAIRNQLVPAPRLPDDFPPSAPLVIAALDGDTQQQTWANAARAVAAASRCALPGGTIVLWSAIRDSLNSIAGEAVEDSPVEEDVDAAASQEEVEQEFPNWNPDGSASRTLTRIAEEYRLLIHCQLDNELVESMGCGVVESEEQLTNLSQSFDSCGVVRAAQFAGTTIDDPNASA